MASIYEALGNLLRPVPEGGYQGHLDRLQAQALAESERMAGVRRQQALQSREMDRNRMRNFIFDFLSGLGAEPTAAEDYASTVGWLPFLGEAEAAKGRN